VGSGPFAENASGAQVAVTGTGPQVSYSPNGKTWSAPVTIAASGGNAAVALSANGRAVVVWDGGTATAPVLQASVMPSGGIWSAPVTIGALTAGARAPLVAMDGSGNAIVAWAGSTGSKVKGPVYTASLPAGGSWTAIHTLVTALAGSVIRLAVNSAGSAIISWSEQDSVEADSGTILGGFGTPAAFGPALQYEDIPRVTSLAINNAGQAVLVYDNQANTGEAAIRSASGTWAGPSALACSFAGDAAIDGAGDALALCEGSNSEDQLTFDSTRLTAGGTWATPVVLSTDNIESLTDAADAAGTFVVALQDATSGAAEVLTSPPGGGFGTAAAFSAFGISSLNMAATGHATLVLSNSSGEFESTEPVS
jgi:hypothetical protein